MKESVNPLVVSSNLTSGVSLEFYEIKKIYKAIARNVQFDVAITVENSMGKEGGIKVAGLLSGEVNSKAKNSTISRVSFQLYIPSTKFRSS